MSEYNKLYSRERYQYLKEHHLCVECGINEAFNHYVRCPECLEKRVNAVHTDKESYQRRNAVKLRTAKRKSEGQCIQCGEPLCKESTRYCSKHLEWQRNYQRRYAAERRARERTKSLDELREEKSQRGRDNIRYALESDARLKHIQDIKNSQVWALKQIS